MIGALNQNNILDVIKADIDDMITMVNDILVKSMANINYTAARKNLSDFNNLISMIFSDKGTVGIIINVINKVPLVKLLKLPILFKTLKYCFKEIIGLIESAETGLKGNSVDYITSINNLISNFGNLSLISNTYDILAFILQSHSMLMKEVENSNISDDITEKLDLLNLSTAGIIDFIKQFEKIDFKTLSLLFLSVEILSRIISEYFSILYKVEFSNTSDDIANRLDLLNLSTMGIIDFIKQFEKIDIKDLIMLYASTATLREVIINYIELLHTIQNVNIDDNVIKVLDNINLSTMGIIDFLTQFKNIKPRDYLALFVFSKVDSKMIIKVFKTIGDIVSYLTEVKVENDTDKKIKVMSVVVESLKKILSNLIILAPLFIGVAILSPVIIMGLVVVRMLIYFIVKLMEFSLNKDAKRNILLLTLITSMLIIVALNMVALALLSVVIIRMWEPLFLFFAILTGVIVLTILISKILVSPKSLLSILLMSIAIGMITFTASLVLLLAITSAAILPYTGKIFLFLLVLVGIAGAIALMGLTAMYAIPLLIAAMGILIPLTIAILAIVTIATMLLMLRKIEFSKNDIDRIHENVKNTIDAAMAVIAGVFYSKGPDEDENNGVNSSAKRMRNDSWFNRLINGISQGSGLVVQALMAAAILVPLVIAMFAILLIAGMLWILGKNKFDPEEKKRIADNVKQVIDTAFLVIDSIFNIESSGTENKPEKRGWFGNLITYVFSGLTNIIGMIMAIGFLALSIVAISMILFLVGELKILESINLDYGGIQERINNVIDCAKSVISAIFETEKKTKDPNEKKSWISSAIDWVSDKVGGIFSGIKNIAGMLASIGFLAMSLVAIGMTYVLAQQLTYLSEIKFTPATVINKINVITATSNAVIDAMSGKNVSDNYAKKVKIIHDNVTKSTGIIKVLKNMVDTMNSMNTISDKNVENNTKLVGNYIKLIEKVNTIKVENVKTMTTMFEKMADFSKSIHGDFESLADALVEKIAPLLQELRDIMSKMPTDFNASMQNSSESISRAIVNTSGSPANWSQDSINKAALIASDKAEQERIRKEQIQKAKEAKAEQEKVSSILQDILDIMTGSGAHPEGVKTC